MGTDKCAGGSLSWPDTSIPSQAGGAGAPGCRQHGCRVSFAKLIPMARQHRVGGQVDTMDI